MSFTVSFYGFLFLHKQTYELCEMRKTKCFSFFIKLILSHIYCPKEKYIKCMKLFCQSKVNFFSFLYHFRVRPKDFFIWFVFLSKLRRESHVSFFLIPRFLSREMLKYTAEYFARYSAFRIARSAKTGATSSAKVRIPERNRSARRARRP